MEADLTESIYCMLVLAYATLVSTQYLFGTFEAGAKAHIASIRHLKDGDCKPIFDGDAANDPKVQAIRSRVDTVLSGSNSTVERWEWLLIGMFISVCVASLLSLPVLSIKLELIKADKLDWLKWVILIEQAFACALVLLTGENLRRMASKLKKIRAVQGDLDTLQVGKYVLNGAPVPLVNVTPASHSR